MGIKQAEIVCAMASLSKSGSTSATAKASVFQSVPKTLAISICLMKESRTTKRFPADMRENPLPLFFVEENHLKILMDYELVYS